MEEADQLRSEVHALRDRMTQLCRATLHITESLDFENLSTISEIG